MNRTLSLLLLIVAFAAVGCRDWFPPVDPDPDPDPDPGSQEFRNIKWRLVAFESNGAVDQVPSNVDANILFNDRSEVSGSNGCNGYGGEYMAGANGSLSFGQLLQTEMACAEPQNTVERRFMQGLMTARSYTLNGDDFRIQSEGVVLRFSKVGPAPGGNDSIAATLGEPFNLKVDQSASVKGEPLVISFERVVEDSRCPAVADCIWAGNAKIALKVAAGGTVQIVELNTFEGAKQVTVMDYVIELVDLAPYPYDTNQIPSSEYVALLRVTRQ